MTTFRNVKNQSHHFMTIFSNPSNLGVTNHDKIKTLRYFRLKSGNTTLDRSTWTKVDLK